MRFRILGKIVLSAGLLFGMAACGDGAGTNIGTLQLVVVTAPSANLAAGASEQFTATWYYGASPTAMLTKVDVTNSVQWNSTNPAAATINTKGMATAVATGKTTITAAMDGITSLYVLTVP